MEHTFKKPRFTRLASLLLALAMVLSMFPVTAFAAAPSLVITNAEGEETDTFFVGEPIFVTANSDSSDWVAMYTQGQANGKSYWFWYYVERTDYTANGNKYTWVNGETYNIYDTVCHTDEYEGEFLPAGKYEIRLENNTSVSKTIEIKEPTTKDKHLTLNKTELEENETLVITARNYSPYAFVGVYAGEFTENPYVVNPKITATKFFYLNGHTDLPMEYALEPGKYTVVMYDDYNGNALSQVTPNLVHVTVGTPEEEPEIPDDAPALATDKTEYKFGEEIKVTTNYVASGSWIGMYAKGDVVDPDNGGVKSIFWNYTGPMGDTQVINLPANDVNGRTADYKAGEFTIVLFKDGYYTPHATVDITITAEIDESKTVRVEPTCTTNGTITYTYTDGTTKVVDHTQDKSLEMLGHDYEGVTPEYIRGERKHTYACKNECDEPKVEACTPDEGRIVSEATNEDPGIKAFTCTVCKGVWEEYYYLDKVETGREVVKEPTCFEQGQWKVYWKDPETGEALEPTFEPIFIVDCEFTKYECDAENLQHQLVCKWCGNTGSGSDITACSDATPEIDTNPKNNCYNYECVCGNTWSESVIILEDDDGIYHLNDLVKVKLNKAYTYSTGKQWIGLYKATEVPSESKAMWFQYLSDVMKGEVNPNGNPYGYFDISQKHKPEAERDLAGYGVGEYLIYLSNTGDYDDAAVMYFEVVACKYDQKVEAPEFLKSSAATCQKGATYYYSCTCGAVDKSASAQTFEGAVNPENHEKTAGWVATAEGHQKTYACCGATLGDVIPHADTKTKDHKCDECGYEMTKHVDADKNHKCDNGCTVDIGEHKDTNKDHTCDYGCDVIIGKCVDENKDHKCDYGCSETFGVCEDKNGDGKCDYGCDKKYETDPTEPDPTEPDPTEPDDKDEPKVEGVDRVAGNDRFQTAVEVADQMKEVLGVEKFNTIIVASGATYADALPGSYLAIVKNAPILLGYSKVKYNALAQDYIKANLAEGGTVYILGGEAAVPASFETALEGIKVVRLAGKNRFETNMLILKEAGVKPGDEIMVCTGADYADALSASAAGKPILLVHKKLFDYQVEFLEGLKDNTFCVIGGEKAVLPAIEEAVSAYGKTERLAGKDRMLTSHMVAERYFDGAETAVVAYGWNFPDGLCGGPLANALKSPLILTHSKEKLYNVTAEFTEKSGIKAGLVLGGTTLIPDAAVNAIYGTTPVALG